MAALLDSNLAQACPHDDDHLPSIIGRINITSLMWVPLSLTTVQCGYCTIAEAESGLAMHVSLLIASRSLGCCFTHFCFLLKMWM